MVLGKVIGTLVASRKEPSLDGLTLLVVRACDVDGEPNGAIAVAVDAVGAGVGEVVLYCAGSSARQTHVTQNRPVDATIMAIVDEVAVEGARRYAKADDRG
jgi:microcompartment protein CcmK/EutM